jgi:acetyl-CoA C-acetyltransferase
MALILSARRTAVAPRGGAFARLSLEALAAPVIRAALADAGLPADSVDEVIVANAIGPGGNPARRAALAAGLPERVAGLTIDRQCTGGLDAVGLAVALIAAGARVVVAGGVESHSQRPLRAMPGPGGPVPYDQAPFTPWPDRDPPMHAAAAALADRTGIGRAAQEAFAAASHARHRAVAGWPEIVPVGGVTEDPYARALTPQLMARAPVLAGTVTAATTAVAADGAAFVVVADDRLMRPGALRLLAHATRGGVPDDPAAAALPAARAVMDGRPAMAEIMEAYAAQAIHTLRELGLDPATVNPQGGALARGHPIGASGAILAVRLFHGLRQGRGLAAIAGAGGIGTAVLVERQARRFTLPR